MPGFVHRDVLDYEHGLSIKTNFAQCPSCGSLVQVPVPSSVELLRYYPSDYRPHASGAAAPRGLLARLKDAQAALFLRALGRHLTPPERDPAILELGCGSGHILFALRRRGYGRLTGVDAQPALASNFEGTGIRFISGNMEGGLRLEGKFDLIFMSYVIEHFADPQKILTQCRSLLSPNGRVVLLTPNSRSLAHRVFSKYWSGLHAPRHTLIFNPQSVALAARAAGFHRTDLLYIADPAGWAFSFQNWAHSRAKSRLKSGTAWYSLVLLPFWYPAALIERQVGRGSAMIAVLS